MNIKIGLLILLFVSILITGNNCSTDEPKLVNDTDSLSYSMGVDLARNLKDAYFQKPNAEVLKMGIIDILKEQDLKIERNALNKQVDIYLQILIAQRDIDNLYKGRRFLEENKKRKGIIVTSSGLQYEIIKEGKGKSPKETDFVKCHYHGTLIDGTVFDSSVERGDTSEFQLNKVMKGWLEGFQLMREGAIYKFYIPTELAFGRYGRPGSKAEPNMALIFEIELFEVVSQ